MNLVDKAILEAQIRNAVEAAIEQVGNEAFFSTSLFYAKRQRAQKDQKRAA